MNLNNNSKYLEALLDIIRHVQSPPGTQFGDYIYNPENARRAAAKLSDTDQQYADYASGVEGGVVQDITDNIRTSAYKTQSLYDIYGAQPYDEGLSERESLDLEEIMKKAFETPYFPR